MFSKSSSFRIAIEATDASGATFPVNPARLAPLAGASAAPYLAGAEHWRHAPVGSTFRHHLAEVGALACELPGVRHVEIRLAERRTLDAEPRESAAAVDCPPS